MLNNLLNTLSFGAVIKSNGKAYTSIMRLTDRLFIVMEANAKLPAPLMLAQADIKMQPGQIDVPVETPVPGPPATKENKTRPEKPKPAGTI